MNTLNNVNYSNGRITAQNPLSTAATQKGIKTFNRFTKILADIFGDGSIKVQVNGKKRYASIDDSYVLAKAVGVTNVSLKTFCKQSKAEILKNIQDAFDILDPSHSLVALRNEAKASNTPEAHYQFGKAVLSHNPLIFIEDDYYTPSLENALLKEGVDSLISAGDALHKEAALLGAQLLLELPRQLPWKSSREDFIKGCELLQIASDLGEKKADYLFAQLYQKGLEADDASHPLLEVNIVSAYAWYLKADSHYKNEEAFTEAEQLEFKDIQDQIGLIEQDAEANYLIGIELIKEENPQNVSDGLEYLLNAAQRGHIEAAWLGAQISLEYDASLPWPSSHQDEKLGIEFLKFAVEGQVKEAVYYYAWLLDEGNKGVAGHKALALIYFQNALELYKADSNPEKHQDVIQRIEERIETLNH